MAKTVIVSPKGIAVRRGLRHRTYNKRRPISQASRERIQRVCADAGQVISSAGFRAQAYAFPGRSDR